MAQDAASGSAPGWVGPSASTAPELRALLADLDDLRLALSADLGLAASAVDVGADQIARDVLAGAQDDLAVFALRSDFRLRDDSRPQRREIEPPADDVAPAPVPLRRPRRLAVLAPALTAAAALIGLLTGVVPATGHPTAPQRTAVTNAVASYAELWRLHEQGAPATSLARAARQLHAEVGRLVGLTALDPATAEQALHLLELELQVLASPQHGQALAAERAESQRLIAALRSAVPSTSAAGAGRVLVGREAPVEPRAAAPRPAAPAVSPARPAARATGTTPGAATAAGASAPASASAPRQQSQPPSEQQQSSPPNESSAPAETGAPSRSERDPRTWFPTAGGRVVLPE